jgi:hypothetical protein
VVPKGNNMKQMKLKAVPPTTVYRPKNILDPAFKYTPSAATDVQATWAKFGWQPPVRKKDESSS